MRSHLIALLFCVLPHALAISLPARRAQTTFALLTNSTRCAASITHDRIATFRNINPAQPERPFDGILWDDLLIARIPCQQRLISRSSQSTYFLPLQTSPPGLPPDLAQPFFLQGRDNSPRKCETFNTTFPATYLFTDDLPTFEDRFLRQGLLDPGLVTEPVRGTVYMFAIPITNDGNIVGRVCAYVEDENEVLPTPTAGTPDMPACFPADAMVETPSGDLPMRRLRVGDPVQTPYGTELILSFTHRASTPARFMKLHAGNASIVLSADHLISVEGRMVPAGSVAVGHGLSGRFGRLVVRRVEEVLKEGLYAPVTGSGLLYVQGVVVSCYTTAFGEVAAHALLGPVRALNRLLWWDACALVDGLRSVFWPAG